MKNRRRAVSLLEVLVAVSILAVLGGPMIANMVFSRRSVTTSSRSIRAVLRAGAVLELLQGVPYPQLPVTAPDETSDLDGEIRGVTPERWGDAFQGSGSVVAIHIPDRIPPDHEDGVLKTYLWIEEIASADEGVDLTAKEITVTVEYWLQAGKTRSRRHYSLRAMILGEGS
jgi:prepilin-type N-terminal cleavage/methylation domain-containing protein